jgi:hypothetical protein
MQLNCGFFSIEVAQYEWQAKLGKINILAAEQVKQFPKHYFGWLVSFQRQNFEDVYHQH